MQSNTEHNGTLPDIASPNLGLKQKLPPKQILPLSRTQNTTTIERLNAPKGTHTVNPSYSGGVPQAG